MAFTAGIVDPGSTEELVFENLAIAIDVDGLRGGTQGRHLIIANRSSFPVTLKHNMGGNTQISNVTGADIVLPPGLWMQAVYVGSNWIGFYANGLGSAAYADVGTGGNTVPKLNTQNTWSAQQFFSTVGGVSTQTQYNNGWMGGWGATSRGSYMLSMNDASGGTYPRAVMYGNNLRVDPTVTGGTHDDFIKLTNLIGGAGWMMQAPNGNIGTARLFLANDTEDDTWVVVETVTLTASLASFATPVQSNIYNFTNGTVTGYCGVTAVPAAGAAVGTSTSHPLYLFTNGSVRVTIDAAGAATFTGRITSNVAYDVSGTQVVGARNTGWTAFSGTVGAVKGAHVSVIQTTSLAAAGATYNQAYTSTVTAALNTTNTEVNKLSGRVRALEEALRAHGLIN